MLWAATPGLASARLCWDTPREAGIEACRQALALALGQPASREAMVRQALARKLAALDRWAEVVSLYRDAARRRPLDPEVQLLLGRALLHTGGAPAEAEAALRESLRLRPGRADALVDLGTVLSVQGRFPDAVAAFEEALAVDADVLSLRPAASSVLAAARRGELWPAP
jgi:Flp pilus assembly protein TadD